MYQLPDLLQKEIVLAVEGDTTLFPAGWKVRLYTNNFTPVKGSAVGDFTELTNVEVPGYVAVAGAWQGTPVRKADGSWEDGGTGPLNFAASAPPPSPQIVYGWFATDSTGATLIGGGRFDTPFTFTTTGDGMNLEQVIRVLQSSGTDYTLTLDMEQE